jgi:hypothetical protein
MFLILFFRFFLKIRREYNKWFELSERFSVPNLHPIFPPNVQCYFQVLDVRCSLLVTQFFRSCPGYTSCCAIYYSPLGHHITCIFFSCEIHHQLFSPNSMVQGLWEFNSCSFNQKILKLGDLLLCSYEPATGPCPDQVSPTDIKIHCNIILLWYSGRQHNISKNKTS